MAKESMKAREVKRAKLVAKYAEKRKALKEAGDWAALDKLPKNSSPSSKRPGTGRLLTSSLRIQALAVFITAALSPDVQRVT